MGKKNDALIEAFRAVGAELRYYRWEAKHWHKAYGEEAHEHMTAYQRGAAAAQADKEALIAVLARLFDAAKWERERDRDVEPAKDEWDEYVAAMDDAYALLVPLRDGGAGDSEGEDE